MHIDELKLEVCSVDDRLILCKKNSANGEDKSRKKSENQKRPWKYALCTVHSLRAVTHSKELGNDKKNENLE